MHGFTVMAVVAAAIIATPAVAQVPDEMPFDVPYGEPITVEQAERVVRAAVAEAERAPRNWKLAIAVTDPGGDLVYFYKMDSTQLASTEVAIGKARTAARFRRPTRAFFDLMQETGGAYAPTLDPTVVASPGGVPLVVNGRIIGAIGCSGATGAQDEVACEAGAAVLR